MSVSFVSNKNAIVSDLQKNSNERLLRAAKHVQKAMRKKVSDVYFSGYHSSPGEAPGKISGNLAKGILVRVINNESFVATKAPAYHALLLEFGTSERYYTTKANGIKKFVGRMEPRPFFLPTWLEEKNTVTNIVSESWEKNV